ncbi:hypothetical protein NPIL_551261 [Nephila pilipes]|uniref:Uncharacterized protein n=1 Tax=Nephila pilipes TaxID=299642 RepID=A0A8X6M575_NEPPI|nr:hypothetical protein NPIL_551261 [Nephila pilipes]
MNFEESNRFQSAAEESIEQIKEIHENSSIKAEVNALRKKAEMMRKILDSVVENSVRVFNSNKCENRNGLNDSQNLVITDYFSKWVEMDMANNKTIGEIIQVLERMIVSFGVPETIVCD